MSSNTHVQTDQDGIEASPSDRVTINIPSHIKLQQQELDSFPAFRTWLSTTLHSLELQSNPSHPFHDDPYKLYSVTIQSIDRFSKGRLGFIKFKADVSNSHHESIPSSVFMRGGSVAMLLVLRAVKSSQPSDKTNVDPRSSAIAEGEEYVILTVQPRVPAGSLAFTEIPAGMLDDSGTFSGAAAKEIEEETGLKIDESELVDLTDLASQSQLDEEEHLQNAVYSSPGGSDEFIPIFYCRKDMSMDEIEELQGRLTGLRDHGEKITLKIVKLKDCWKVVRRDGKSLAALCLLENLRREGKIG